MNEVVRERRREGEEKRLEKEERISGGVNSSVGEICVMISNQKLHARKDNLPAQHHNPEP